MYIKPHIKISYRLCYKQCLVLNRRRSPSPLLPGAEHWVAVKAVGHSRAYHVYYYPNNSMCNYNNFSICIAFISKHI